MFAQERGIRMFFKLFKAEWLKLKRTRSWIIIFLGPLLGVVFALINFFNNMDIFMTDPDDNGWVEAWTQLQIFYGSLILPILTGVYSALICRFEQIGGGWKQLISLPIPRTPIYLSKLVLAYLLLAITQLVTLALFLILGWITGVPSDIPWSTLFGFISKGWIATLPLATLQMAISVHWRSFGIPLAVNIVFSIPVLLVSYSKFGQYYPWALPNMAMSPVDESPITSFALFYTIIFSLLILTTLIGLYQFLRREFHH
jgi:hypothetical protein